MAKIKNGMKSAKQLREFQCLKIIESFINGDIKTADRYLKHLVERRIGNKMKYVLQNEKLI